MYEYLKSNSPAVEILDASPPHSGQSTKRETRQERRLQLTSESLSETCRNFQMRGHTKLEGSRPKALPVTAKDTTITRTRQGRNQWALCGERRGGGARGVRAGPEKGKMGAPL
jgi:hypothetical protein